MKRAIKTLIILLAIFGVLPCSARIDGNISKTNFYDLEKTLMPEITPDLTLKTGKYWEKNLFHINKYRPIFMLSNKELYNFAPEKRVSAYQRVASPMIYNISLKESSIKKISLSPPIKKVETKKALPKVAKTVVEPITKTPSLEQNQDALSAFLFEQAKNQGVESYTKLSTALDLKKTKKPANYTLALDLLDDVTRTEPYNAAAYNLKAEIYLAKNDPESAMKNYIEVLNLNPYSKESCLGIAKILEPTNKTLAQKYYDRANQ